MKFDYYSWQNLIYVSFLFIVLTRFVSRKIGKLNAIFSSYFVLWGVYRCFFEELYTSHSPLAALVLEVQANNFLSFSLLFGAALYLLNPGKKNIENAFCALGFVNGVITIARYPFAETIWWRGVIANPSMNAVLTAICIPFMIERLKTKWIILAIFAVLSSKSFTAIAILTFYSLWAINQKIKLGPKLIGISTIVISASIGGFLYFRGLYSIFRSGRLVVWKESIQYFLESEKQLFGFGPGSFFVYGPVIQKLKNAYNEEKDTWIMMHSDVLQTLFEFGWIGLTLILLLSFLVLRRAHSTNTKAYLGLVAYFIAMLNYYPLHWPSHLLLLMGLLWISYEPYLLSDYVSILKASFRASHESQRPS